MKKKLISLFICGTLILSLLSGCGKDSSDKKSKDDNQATELSLWLPPLDDNTEENFKPLLDKFEKENSCKVQLELIPWESYQEKYTTAINAGEGPDVGYMYAEMFPTFIDAKAVSDMESYLTEDDYKEFTYLKNGQMMGGTYGFPLVTGVPFVLYYNKDILDSLSVQPPTTWDEFMTICKTATKDTDGDGKVDQYGYAAGFSSGDMSNLYILNSYYYSLLWQAGGDIYSDDLKSVRFNDEAGIRAVEFLKSLKPYMPENSMSLSGTDAFQTVFGQGKAAFSVTRSSQVQDTLFAKTYPDLNWDYVTSLKETQYGTFGAVDSLTLMSKCENKELGMKLIKEIVSPEFMTEYHKKCPGAPMSKSEAYQGDEKMERIVTVDSDKYRPLQVGPCGSEILEYLASKIQSVMEGTSDTKAALDDAAKYADGLLDDYWADKK